MVSCKFILTCHLNQSILKKYPQTRPELKSMEALLIVFPVAPPEQRNWDCGIVQVVLSGCRMMQAMQHHGSPDAKQNDEQWPIESMVLVDMRSHWGYIDGIHVAIYSSTMDPMGDETCLGKLSYFTHLNLKAIHLGMISLITNKPWFPGLGRTVRSWWNLPRHVYDCGRAPLLSPQGTSKLQHNMGNLRYSAKYE